MKNSGTFRGTFEATLVVWVIGSSIATAQGPPITSIAFSDDGKSVVACSQSGLQVYGWPELNLQKTLKASAANLHCLAFSPIGTQLAVGGGNPSDEGIIEIFSWPEGKSLLTLSGHDDSVMSLAWRDESRLASASLDRKVMFWDLARKESTKTYRGHSRGVTAVCLLKDGTMVTAGRDQSVRVWNAVSGELIRSLNQHTKPVNGLALRPAEDGLPMVASAAGDRTVRFWQPTIGRMVRYVRLIAEPLDIAWTNDGSRILAACVDGRIHVIDPEDVKVTQTVHVIDGWAYAIGVHPSDGCVAVGGTGGQIRKVQLSQETAVESAVRTVGK